MVTLGRLKQLYGQMDKYKVELKEYNDALKTGENQNLSNAMGQRNHCIACSNFTSKRDGKGCGQIKTENELKRLKNIKREQNRRKRQKELRNNLPILLSRRNEKKKR